MTTPDKDKLLHGSGDLPGLAEELERVGTAFPRRINADPEQVERGLAQLVLTLVELLRSRGPGPQSQSRPTRRPAVSFPRFAWGKKARKTTSQEESMAALKDAEQLTKNLEDLVGQLRKELGNGNVDFEKLVTISDEISEQADGIAETFSAVNDTLMQRIQQVTSGKSSGSGQRERSGSRSGGNG